MKEKHRKKTAAKEAQQGSCGQANRCRRGGKRGDGCNLFGQCKHNLSQTEGGAGGHVSLYDKIWQ